MKKIFPYSVLFMGVAMGSAAFAQSSDVPKEEIVVKAHPLFKDGSAQSLIVLSGDELAEVKLV